MISYSYVLYWLFERVFGCLPKFVSADQGVHGAVWYCLAKTITAPHLIFAVTYAVRCGLEFSQNHNHNAPHFCNHMCGAVYKM